MLDLLAPFLLGVCRRYERSDAEVQDRVQEALIRIFNNMDQCRGEEKAFWVWCRRIAIHVCLQAFRKKRVPTEVMDSDAHHNSAPPDVLGKMGVDDILALLGTLPENQRIVFNLYVLDGYSHAEIARELNLAESHSRTLLTRARAALQALITQKEALSNGYQ